jgi:hypothetical protein
LKGFDNPYVVDENASSKADFLDLKSISIVDPNEKEK